jgi:hypothetical protein
VLGVRARRSYVRSPPKLAATVSNLLFWRGGIYVSLMTDDTPDEVSGSDESHVDRAALGPTPDNPSLSLKKRLKRAAFFDQRDRQVAAGAAEALDTDAGLPEQMVEDLEALSRQ